jgi:hypothetical protein
MEIFWIHAQLGVERSASDCSKFICGKGATGKKRIESKVGLEPRVDVAVRRKTCSFAENKTLVFQPGT